MTASTVWDGQHGAPRATDDKQGLLKDSISVPELMNTGPPASRRARRKPAGRRVQTSTLNASGE